MFIIFILSKKNKRLKKQNQEEMESLLNIKVSFNEFNKLVLKNILD